MIPLGNAYHDHIITIIKFKSDLKMSHFKCSADLNTQHRTKGKVFPVHSIKA